MNLKELTPAQAFCPAVPGIGAIPINEDGYLEFPESLSEEQIEAVKLSLLETFPGADV